MTCTFTAMFVRAFGPRSSFRFWAVIRVRVRVRVGVRVRVRVRAVVVSVAFRWRAIASACACACMSPMLPMSVVRRFPSLSSSARFSSTFASPTPSLRTRRPK